MSDVLELIDISAGYGQRDVLHGVCLAVPSGKIVALLGANGAGKTTTLRAISGMIRTVGTVRFHGSSIDRSRPHKRAGLGIAHVPQGRGTISHLTVHENLRAGAAKLSRGEFQSSVDHWYTLFPRLAERRKQSAGNLSGGEQQMLALARALISKPDVVLLDEPTLGLAPQTAADTLNYLVEVNRATGVGILLVEQNAAAGLRVADHVYLMELGRIVRHGPSDEMAQDDAIRRAYLGS